jgi:hypothetical protein
MQGRQVIKGVKLAYFPLDRLTESLCCFLILIVRSPDSDRGSLAAIRVLSDESAAGDRPKSLFCGNVSELQEGIFVISVAVHDNYYRRRVVALDPP